VPVGYFKTMHNPATDWCYMTEPEPGLNGRSLQWPRGRVLGGSSSINGLLYIRGQRQDYDHWRQLGNAGWSYDDVLPYFRKSEDQEQGGDDYHGAGGPIAVSGVRIHRKLCDVFIDAAEEVGIPRNDDFNGANQEGAGYFQQTCRKGLRCSTAVGYLNPVKSRPNLKIVTRALVQRVLFDGNRAAGVAWTVKGQAGEARSRGEVILSTGAIGSPQILMLSGVGPAQHLKDTGIEPVHDLAGVGENLQDHLQIRSVYKTREPITLNDEVNNPIRKMLMGIEYILFRTGPLTIAASQVCVFTKTDPGMATPDIQFHIQPLSADKPGEGPHKFSAFTASVCQLRPESRGQILLKSPDPSAHPAIHANYLSTATDRDIAVKAIKVTRKIAATEALGSLISDRRGIAGIRPQPQPDHLSPGRHLQDGGRFDGGGRRAASCPRNRRTAGRRRVDHAETGVRQHQRPRHHDRREGGGHDPRGCAALNGPEQYQGALIRTHLMGLRGPPGQARSAARCPRIGQGPQRTRRAAKPHRRPISLDRRLRCAPLVVRGATARTAPDQRSREIGQMGLYQRSLVLRVSGILVLGEGIRKRDAEASRKFSSGKPDVISEGSSRSCHRGG
jgi:choline dehydrogenase